MKNNTIFAEMESAVCSYARAFPSIYTRAVGSEIWDTTGKRYLDFLAGAGSLNYGHNNPLLKAALLDYLQQDGITHSLDLHTEAKQNFLMALRDLILQPRGLDYVVQFTGPTGTNAVEAALKLARKVTGRTGIIFFTNGFHGVSMGALSVTGSQSLRNAAGIPFAGTMVMPYDRYFGEQVDTIAYLERFLADPSSGVGHPAAVIIEGVQGEGGLNAAQVAWLQALQRLCQAREILLIVDDIQAGCGRTGDFFSFEAAQITPDLITLSKSLSGYGQPLSVLLIKRALDVWQPGEHNGTFRGNNLAFVTATAALEHYWRTPEFSQAIKAKGEYLAQRLEAMVDRFAPDLVEVRGRGMMRGVRCADPKQAAAVSKEAFKNGLIIERAGPEDEVLKCMMPLTTDYTQLNEGLDIVEQALVTILSLQ